MSGSIVLAIHPRHADHILAGRKDVELRRRFPAVPSGTIVYLYATAPVSAIIGGFVVAGRTEGNPSEIWKYTRHSLQLSYGEFASYLRGAESATAVHVSSPFRLRRPASVRELSGIAGQQFCAPQSALFLRDSSLALHLSLLSPSGAPGAST